MNIHKDSKRLIIRIPPSNEKTLTSETSRLFVVKHTRKGPLLKKAWIKDLGFYIGALMKVSLLR